MAFAAEYRAVVAPRLRRVCRYHALLIVIRSQTFAEAMVEVLELAYRLGASRLPEDLRWDLHDHIADWLLAAVDEELRAYEAQHQLAAKVELDAAYHEALRRPVTPP